MAPKLMSSKKLLNYDPPYGGMNQRDNAVNMAPRFCQVMENYVPYSTFISSRGGQSEFNSVRDSGSVRAMYALDSDTVLVLSDNMVKKVTSSSYTNVASITGNPTKAMFTDKGGKVYLATTDDNFVIDTDNSSHYSLGMPQAGVIDNDDIELNAPLAGALDSGFYRYVKQYIRKSGSTVVSRGGIVTPTVTDEGTVFLGFDGTAKIINRWPTDNDVTHIRYYRTFRYTADDIASGQIPTEFFYVGDSAVGEEVFTDSIQDNGLIGESDIAEEFEFEELPASGIIAKVGGRTFTTNGATVYYTHNFGGSWDGIYATAGHIYYKWEWADGEVQRDKIISVSGQFEVPNGREIKALKELGQDLYIFTDSKTYVLRNSGDNLLVSVEEVPEAIGCLSHNGVVEHDRVLFVNTSESDKHGMRQLAQGQYSDDVVGYRHETDMESIVDFSSVFMFVFQDQVWMGCKTEGSNNNRTMCFKKVNTRWSYFRHTINTEYAVALPNGSVITYDGATGLYMKQNDTNQDNGEDIECVLTLRASVPVKRGDLLFFANAKLNMETEYWTQIEYSVTGTVDGGVTRVYPADSVLNTYGEANWNRGDLTDASSLRYFERIDNWEVKFDNHAFGERIDVTIRKKNNENSVYKGMVINTLSRSAR